MSKTGLNKLVVTVLGWLIGIIFFFPIFWMGITAFKTEKGAYSPDLIFTPTLESFGEVFARSNYFLFARNSLLISLGSTLLCFLLAIPSAYRMAFFPTQKSQSTMLWMLSTKMMPAVGVLIPIYIIWQRLGLLDSVPGLIIIYTLINLPIAVWMAYTYFMEVPKGILEAARIDGADVWKELWYLLRPMTMPGLASTALLLIIFSWNEAFWSINLTSANAAPLPVFIASYSSPEGLFWAKLSAASFLAVVPRPDLWCGQVGASVQIARSVKPSLKSYSYSSSHRSSIWCPWAKVLSPTRRWSGSGFSTHSSPSTGT